LRRVWLFCGIFCLTFFREGCSPAAPPDEPPLVVSYLVPDIGESEAYRIEITSGETSAKLSESSYILQVRYKPHLSDKARCSEASRFSVTKIWYVNLYTSVSITACHYLYISAGHEHNAMENVFTEHSAKYKIRMLTVDLQIYIYIYIYISFHRCRSRQILAVQKMYPEFARKVSG